MGENQTIQGGAARVLQAYFWRKVSKTYPGETSRHRLYSSPKKEKGRIVMLSQKQSSV